MSTMESYGVVGEGGGGVQNKHNSGPPSSHASGGSIALMPNTCLDFSSDGVYKPVMPQNSPHSAPPTPPPTYQGSGGGGDGSAVVVAALPSINPSAAEQTKRKRGRPRKYALDGSMAPILAPTPPARPQLKQESAFDSGGFSSLTPAAGKKPRGRPPGSGRKHQVAAPGSQGVGFAPHVIIVKAGEDVSSKIMSFSQDGARAICILSGNGAISNVTLRQPATSGGTVTYEGRYEILSLSGSYMLVESGGQRSRTGGLSVLLAAPDGSVLGGGVAGLLIAAAPVQVVVGCFMAVEELESPNQANLATAPVNLVLGASGAGSSASHGTLSESSGGLGSPLNQSTGACNNSNPQGMSTFSWN